MAGMPGCCSWNVRLQMTLCASQQPFERSDLAVQTTEKEAKRASIVVRLLFEFIELLLAMHERAVDLSTLR